ncbi:hypothetical protein [Aureliella helgolandensis]|uniref:Glucose-6-phosphate isomerase n=1 Tax=Aureliella helgolandensis TaxID=2527968 RepID=A0A518GH31_9BACT|nr:hypothetical protein [Aureliella helgolandensis]QDV27906.1 Glucose-6-phosphate isomerase [Aureliella helgolandensis]
MPPLLNFDSTDAFPPGGGERRAKLSGLASVLDRLRDELVQLDGPMLAGSIATPAEKLPLHSGFFQLPQQQLASYQADRQGSELALVLAVTKRLMTEVDSIVVLGSETASLGAEAMLASCCQPYFNQLSRGARGSRPRMYFAGNSLGNDPTQGLLQLLNAHRAQTAVGVQESWGVVVIDPSGEDRQVQAVLEPFLRALAVSCGGDPQLLRSRFIAVTGAEGELRGVAERLACPNVFSVPPSVGERFSLLSHVGLVPGALMGINIMKLMEGAQAIDEHFSTTKAADNIVLQLAAVSYLADVHCDEPIRALCVWNDALEATGRWYEHVVTGALNHRRAGPTPLTVTMPRDYRRFGQQCQNGPPNKLVHYVRVERSRFDPLRSSAETSGNWVNGLFVAEPSGGEADVAPTLPSVLDEVYEDALQGMREARIPATQISIPILDEYYQGQLFQLLMLATVVEGRLRGINPYR